MSDFKSWFKIRLPTLYTTIETGPSARWENNEENENEKYNP